MTKRDIITLPDPLLRRSSAPVERVDDELRQLIDDMLDVTAEADVLGKTPGKDQASGKRTHVAEMGLNRAGQLADELTGRAAKAALELGAAGQKLKKLAELLCERSH